MAAAPVVSPVKLNASEEEAILQKLEAEVKTPSIVYNMAMNTFNKTSKYLYSSQQELWSDTEGSSPVPIPSGYFTTERFNGRNDTGVKFGRVYVDSQMEVPTTRKFIIAIDSPAGKVYAETGPIGPVDWEVVKVRLSNGESSTDVVDSISGGRVQIGFYRNGNAYVVFSEASPSA